MGNVLFAECKKCQVCNAASLGLDRCELRTEASTADQGNAGAPPRQTASTPAQDGGGRSGRARHEYQPADMSEADMVERALHMSRLEAEWARRSVSPGSSRGRGHQQSEEEQQLEAAARKAESEERARLREEQEAEYEESLRIDREREAEKALRAKEEEEQRQREAEEEEARQREVERLRAEAEEVERARRARAEAVVEAARAELRPEPGPEETELVQVLVRTPHGARLRRSFRAGDPIGQLYHYVNIEGGEDLAGSEYRLVSSLPRVVYEERDVTLKAAGLQGQHALLVEVLDD